MVWPIDSAHQRWTEASIKKPPPTRSWEGGVGDVGGRGSSWRADVPAASRARTRARTLLCSEMSYRAALLNSALWETDGGSADELLPNA